MSTSISARRLAAPIWLAVGAVVALGLFVVSGADQAKAAPEAPVETLYLSVTGEGPTARAWFEGAQPSGLPLQRALDGFNKEGYRAVLVTEPHPSKAGNGEFVWAILMQRTK